MEKYSKAVSGMYSQFEKREAHPMEKYVGRHAVVRGSVLEVVGYSAGSDDIRMLIVDAFPVGGWTDLWEADTVFRVCKSYWYVRIDDLID